MMWKSGEILVFYSRSSHLEVFLEKGVLKICSKFTGEHTCRSVISIKLQSNFIEITLRHGCSPVNLLHIFRTPFSRNNSRQLFLLFSDTNFHLRSAKFFILYFLITFVKPGEPVTIAVSLLYLVVVSGIPHL